MGPAPTSSGGGSLRRTVAGGLVALAAIAASALLGAEGSPSVSSPAMRGPEPSARPSQRSFTTSVNPACTEGRRFTAVDRGLGPYCLPPDAIRAIDRPIFAPVADATSLDPSEPVIALELDGAARAYPVRILVWHEIVNDRVGGAPVAVTFCPLCNSPITFDRRVAGRTLTYAVSGRLIRGNLVMFDRETETLWQQLTGEPIRGPLEEESLRLVPSRMIPFGEFRRSHPRGQVMTAETGFDEAYGQDPYGTYGLDPEQPSSFQFGAQADQRLPPKQRVLGLVVGDDAAAVPYPTEAGKHRVIRARIGERRVTVLLAHGAGQPATAGSFEEARPGWSGAAFEPRVGGRAVRLAATARGFVDRRTGSLFGLAGRAISGPLTGRGLKPVRATDAYWFAWSSFYPDTRIVD